MGYQKSAERAKKMLKRAGLPVVLMVVTSGQYDPATGTASSSSTTHAGHGFADNYKQSDIDGSLVRQSDMRVYLDALIGVTPKTGDMLDIGGVSYAVVISRPMPPVGIIVLHDVQVRR